MKKAVFALCPLLAVLVWLVPLRGESPVKLAEVAPVEDLVREAEVKASILAELLVDDPTWQEEKRAVAQATGVLACLGQAIAEHPGRQKVKASGPALREAAFEVAGAGSRDAALAGLERVKQAIGGEAAAEAQVEHPWNELIDVHPLMEEVNGRVSRLRRIVRRPGDPAEDSLHATTLAVLALAIYADSGDIEAAELGKWRQYSLDMQQSMTELAAALKQKDSAATTAAWQKGLRSCSACHEAFRND